MKEASAGKENSQDCGISPLGVEGLSPLRGSVETDTCSVCYSRMANVVSLAAHGKIKARAARDLNQTNNVDYQPVKMCIHQLQKADW